MSTLALQLIPGGTVVDILDRVGKRFGVTWEELLGRRRLGHIVNARQVAAWLMRQRGLSYPAIGRAVGGRDHTTAMHAVAAVERERAESIDVTIALDDMAAAGVVHLVPRGMDAESGARVLELPTGIKGEPIRCDVDRQIGPQPD